MNRTSEATVSTVSAIYFFSAFGFSAFGQVIAAPHRGHFSALFSTAKLQLGQVM